MTDHFRDLDTNSGDEYTAEVAMFCCRGITRHQTRKKLNRSTGLSRNGHTMKLEPHPTNYCICVSSASNTSRNGHPTHICHASRPHPHPFHPAPHSNLSSRSIRSQNLSPQSPTIPITHPVPQTAPLIPTLVLHLSMPSLTTSPLTSSSSPSIASRPLTVSLTINSIPDPIPTIKPIHSRYGCRADDGLNVYAAASETSDSAHRERTRAAVRRCSEVNEESAGDREGRARRGGMERCCSVRDVPWCGVSGPGFARRKGGREGTVRRPRVATPRNLEMTTVGRDILGSWRYNAGGIRACWWLLCTC